MRDLPRLAAAAGAGSGSGSGSGASTPSPAAQARLSLVQQLGRDTNTSTPRYTQNDSVRNLFAVIRRLNRSLPSFFQTYDRELQKAIEVSALSSSTPRSLDEVSLSSCRPRAWQLTSFVSTGFRACDVGFEDSRRPQTRERGGCLGCL